MATTTNPTLSADIQRYISATTARFPRGSDPKKDLGLITWCDRMGDYRLQLVTTYTGTEDYAPGWEEISESRGGHYINLGNAGMLADNRGEIIARELGILSPRDVESLIVETA